MSLDPRSIVHQATTAAKLNEGHHVLVTGDAAVTSQAVPGLTDPLAGAAQLEQENQALKSTNERLVAEIERLRGGPRVRRTVADPAPG